MDNSQFRGNDKDFVDSSTDIYDALDPIIKKKVKESMTFQKILKLTKDFTYKKEYNNIANKTLSWGTNNKKDGNRPNTDISNEELKKYNAYAMGPDKKVIYLTFDEGTMTSYLPQIVEVLNKNNVKCRGMKCFLFLKILSR